jgi:hypothetical protein
MMSLSRFSWGLVLCPMLATAAGWWLGTKPWSAPLREAIAPSAVAVPDGLGGKKKLVQPAAAPTAAEIAPAAQSLFAKQRDLIRDLRTRTLKDFPDLIEEINEISNQYERRSLRELAYQRWAELDAKGAVAIMRKFENGSQFANFLSAWGRAQPEAALRWAGEQSRQDEQINEIGDMLTSLSAVAPKSVLAAMSDLPKGLPIEADGVRNTFAALARTDPALADEVLAKGFTNSWYRANAMAGLAHARAQQDPAAALTWAEALPEGVRATAIRETLMFLPQQDLERTLASVGRSRNSAILIRRSIGCGKTNMVGNWGSWSRTTWARKSAPLPPRSSWKYMVVRNMGL